MKIKVLCNNCDAVLVIDPSNAPDGCPRCGQKYWLEVGAEPQRLDDNKNPAVVEVYDQ